MGHATWRTGHGSLEIYPYSLGAVEIGNALYDQLYQTPIHIKKGRNRARHSPLECPKTQSTLHPSSRKPTTTARKSPSSLCGTVSGELRTEDTTTSAYSRA